MSTPYALQHISYKEYLQTDHWKEIRSHMLWLYDRCQVCGSKRRQLQVHHNNYGCLFAETPQDLAVLCSKCHALYEEAKSSVY